MPMGYVIAFWAGAVVAGVIGFFADRNNQKHFADLVLKYDAAEARLQELKRRHMDAD